MAQDVFWSDSAVSPEELDNYLNINQLFEFELDDLDNFNILDGHLFEQDSPGILGHGGTTDVPSPTCQLPSFEDYPGPLKFDVQLGSIGSKTSYSEFSEKLNKIFLTMGTKIPFDFTWNQYSTNLYVRALIIFLDEDSLTLPVKRCPNHFSDKEKSNSGFLHVHHVIRCDNKQTIYDTNEESGRLSVLVPLDPPQPGTKETTINFTFMCKNSCVLGMNRRPTGLIFTLETENGTVVGRRTMKVRICSCPKRDKKNEEYHLQAKAKSTESAEQTELAVPKGRTSNVKKKPLKRLSTEVRHDMVTIRVPVPRIYKKKILKHLREMISLPEVYRDLTEAEKITVNYCSILD